MSASTAAGSRGSAASARTTAAVDDVAVRVLRQFRLVFNAIRTHFQQVEKKVGLGGAQVWALHVIRERPGLGMKDLAQAMDVRQPTASNLVRGLVAQGMVEVRKEAVDRRAVQLHVLAPGMRVLKKAPGPFAGVLPNALASLDVATLKRLEKDLARIITALGADERAANIPLGQM